MAGSEHSGEEMQSGRTNRAEDRTRIWAQRTDSDDGNDFNGDAIFIVEVAGDVEDPSDFLDNDWKPQHSVDGIEAFGWKDGTGIIGNGGKNRGVGVIGNGVNVGVIGNGGDNTGTGVVGNGGSDEGTGVRGLGGGRRGTGGIGVHGVGGSWDDTNQRPPGIGVLGQGGRRENPRREPHGTGIVGLAGVRLSPVLPPSLKDIGSVGVYGQGAEAEEIKINFQGVEIPVGPIEPGPGVLGRGGVPILHDMNLIEPDVAAGVIGLAGDTPIPPISRTGNTGVYGMGPRGVVGETDTDVGVFGLANKDTGRGGVFKSERSAQVRLVPQSRPVKEERPLMPKDGQCGDLMSIVGEDGQCTLWFCVQGEGGGPARWARVLLGPPFDGQV